MNTTYEDFLYLIALMPTLTAFGRFRVDHPNYFVHRSRLVNSFDIFKQCEEWIDKNSIPPHIENTMQLKHAIEKDIGDYVPSGVAALAAQVVFGFDVPDSTDDHKITFSDYPEVIEESRELLKGNNQ